MDIDIDIDTFLASLHKDVNAAALILEPGCFSLAFLYCEPLSAPTTLSK